MSNYAENDNDNIKQSVEKRNMSIRVLIGIYVKFGAERSVPIYKEWYEEGEKDIDSFKKKYPVDIENNIVQDIVFSHNKWCQMVKIEGTPTLYVNGSELPLWYNVEDLKYFIHQ